MRKTLDEMNAARRGDTSRKREEVGLKKRSVKRSERGRGRRAVVWDR